MGWSDAFALYMSRKVTDTELTNAAIGWYVAGQASTGNGVRRYPYSTDLKTNPLLFSNLQVDTVVHRIGEVWAVILYEMYWQLVKKNGFSPNWLDASQTQGNIIALQIIMGGVS
jgi:Fungalysin metallopeptidase (M36)